jgi:rubrerythrin
MSNEKFTQGEWKRAMNKSRNGKGAIRGLSHCRIENEKGVVVAFAVPQKSRQEQIANTNLIAAAPEMYKMLAITRKMFEDLADIVPNEQAKDLLYDMASDIKSVLKKARGEE